MKKIIALLLALVLAAGSAFMLASCGKDEAETTTAAPAPSTAVYSTTQNPSEPESPAAQPETTAQPTTEETTTEAPTTQEPTTTAPATTAKPTTTKAPTTKKPTTTKKATTTKKPAAKAPSSTAEVLKVYNDAVNGAISAKAGYSKTRATSISSLEGGALMRLQLVKDTVNDFLGVGTTDYQNAKGKAAYMSKASLSASDVSSAKCTENNGKYTVTISLKDGSSSASASGSSDSSPLGKTGLFVGKGDNADFDYKSSDNVYTAINGIDGGSAESVNLSTSKGKITAVINASNGRLEKLTVSFEFNVRLKNVKYSIAKISEGTGVAFTEVTYSSFKY